MTNDEEIVQKEMANHDKHYWALVQTLKHKRKGWGELADLIGEGSTVAKAIWDKYENFDFYNPDRLGAAVSAPPQPKCKVCNGSDLIVSPFGDFLLNIFCNGCGHEVRYEHPCDLRTLVGAFFAAAPAQTISDRMQGVDCPLCESGEPHKHVAPNAAKVKRIKELLAEWDALAKEVTQEQPVENSPQKQNGEKNELSDM